MGGKQKSAKLGDKEMMDGERREKGGKRGEEGKVYGDEEREGWAEMGGKWKGANFDGGKELTDRERKGEERKGRSYIELRM